ncbi:MAG: mycothiol system anti-sigma-R factor [Propionicimonas sp.]|uniref:mycothiol system anti-sigma-R factor n=1 Tax=Propionicimonas sp. TaxID=1955623 RepID=UPI002B20C69B|nr:mycothiol system anti-sigma-R factor [Propionicimonas sp.]MEA4944119.1 mycothiol system anti-sigma-R factor [Propionicimonas sp.]MEA5052154.1 mycothiol system anti-sigma-R factor [Propionicimonas sp.]MEA5118746.1 mycothiol system anti-sigma-R factor [Propionicimonas sp.]
MSESELNRDECSHVLEQVYEFHDHELSEAEAEDIRAHLMACEPCLDRYDVEQAMRELIRRSCAAERASESLRMRVKATFTRTVIVTEG